MTLTIQPTGVGEYVRLRAVAAVVNSMAGIRGSVVDVGGGAGHLMQRLRADLQSSYTVVDELNDGHGRRLIGDISALPIPDRSADVIVCSDVLEHVDDDVALIRHLLTKVAPQGVLVVHVPAIRSSRLPGFEAARERAEQLDHQDHPHVRDGYLSHELDAMVRAASSRVRVEVRPSFTKMQSLTAEVDWWLWNKRLTPVRASTILAARLMRGTPRSLSGSAGLLAVVTPTP